MGIALALHVLFVVIWIGGMIFSIAVMRPVMAERLEPPQLACLMAALLGRFFRWVWAAIVIIPVTGFYMIFAGFGGFAHLGWHIHLMTGLGLVMIGIYLWLFVRLYRSLTAALAAGDRQSVPALLGRIRWWITLNMSLGIAVVLIATGGRYG